MLAELFAFQIHIHRSISLFQNAIIELYDIDVVSIDTAPRIILRHICSREKKKNESTSRRRTNFRAHAQTHRTCLVTANPYSILLLKLIVSWPALVACCLPKKTEHSFPPVPSLYHPKLLFFSISFSLFRFLLFSPGRGLRLRIDGPSSETGIQHG